MCQLPVLVAGDLSARASAPGRRPAPMLVVALQEDEPMSRIWPFPGLAPRGPVTLSRVNCSPGVLLIGVF